MCITSSPPSPHHFADSYYYSMNPSDISSSSNINNNNTNSSNHGRLTTSSTEHRSIRHRTIPRLRSNLSAVDTKFVELTRCLYQAKSIVQDLSSFQASVLPTLSLSTYHDPAHSPQREQEPEQQQQQQRGEGGGVGSAAFFQHIKKYLDDNFSKFTRLCKILMMILSRLEQNAQVKQELVQSFRNDIMEEWRVANDIKRRIQTYLNQNTSLFDGSNNRL